MKDNKELLLTEWRMMNYERKYDEKYEVKSMNPNGKKPMGMTAAA